MAIRMWCMQIMYIGFLMVPLAQAHNESEYPSTAVRSSLSHVLGQVSFNSIDAMFAKLPLSQLDDKLIELVAELTYGKSPKQVVQAIADFYKNTGMPLVKAVKLLVKQRDYVGAATDVAQCIFDVLPANSADKVRVAAWISDLKMIATCIEYVLVIIHDNPALVAKILH
jgi:hypothetical protein